MINIKKIFCALIIAWASGCAQNPNDASSAQSLVESNGKWGKRVLNTCFALASASPTRQTFTTVQRRIIRDVAYREFSASNTNIQFSGFEDCPEIQNINQATNYDVVFYRNPSYKDSSQASTYVITEGQKPRSGFGAGALYSGPAEGFRVEKLTKNQQVVVIVGLEVERYCNGKDVRIGYEPCVAGVTLHELGHVLGLRHEHARPEALKDPNCAIKRSVDLNHKEQPGLSSETFGFPYDPNSIMNYCYMDAYETGLIPIDMPSLSKTDRDVLRRLYP